MVNPKRRRHSAVATFGSQVMPTWPGSSSTRAIQPRTEPDSGEVEIAGCARWV